MVIKRRLAVSEPAKPAAGPQAGNLFTRGNQGAKIVVVCEPNSVKGYQQKMPMDFDSLQRVAKAATNYGLKRDDFQFISLCPPIPEADSESAARKWKHVEANAPTIMAQIEKMDPECIVTLGELATRVVQGKACAITKARGRATTMPVCGKDRVVLPMLAPSFIGRVPDNAPLFDADWLVLAKLRNGGWRIAKEERNYEWREDISDILRDPPPLISLDTETTGLRWWDSRVRVLTVQFAWEHGRAIAVPVHRGYWPSLNPRQMARLRAQIGQLVADPRVRKAGHNIKYDDRMLKKEGMPVNGWKHDTQLMAFATDENMMNFQLDTCVRRWVPEMAGYSDEFDGEGWHSHMIDVPYDKMLEYGCGDVDADLRLMVTLDQLLDRDKRQRNCYERLMMPGIMSFARKIEDNGILIDKDHLRAFGGELNTYVDEQYRSLIERIPATVRLKHADKGLSFSRTEFVRDALFSREGFNLTPVVFTKGTRKAEKAEDREPSTSAKDHLPYFTDHEQHGPFINDLIDYQKTVKLLGTYVGEEAQTSGFWQYIAPDGRIYPSYMLHRTVTGRTASADPNGQNFPKRGRLAKPYLKIFQATPGFKIISADLSQIELRIAAWMAMDRAMLRIYQDGGDIHTATAKYVSQLSDAQWDALSKAERKLKRTQAKAVNFGFLYGMGWAKFMSYAKTDYGVTYSEKEAKESRERFFTLYSALPAWHDRMREFARENGYVRALHGAVRHLPAIRSNDKMIRSGAERQAINSPVQRLGSDLGLMAVIRFSQQADPDLFRPIGFVHDAVLVEARDGYEQECMSALVWAMENQPLQEWFGLTPPLPIKAEADIGINFGESLEMAELPAADKRPDWFNEMGFDTFEPTKPDWWDDDKEERALAEFRANFQVVRN